MRFKVQGAEVNELGEVDLPEDTRIIGVMYHPVTLKLLVAILTEVVEKEPKKKEIRLESEEKKEPAND